MMDNNYQPPVYKAKSFHCPHCITYAHQRWYNESSFLINIYESEYGPLKHDDKKWLFNKCYLTTCAHCVKFSIWIDGKMVYPLTFTSPPPRKDMPDNVKKTYEEAQQVQPFSTRASAALLRIALEQLTEYLGETKGSLNTRIKNLNSKGLPNEAVQCLDIVRIYANVNAHADREINIENEDNEEIVNKLFQLVNFIVEKTISDQKLINDLLDKIPENKKQGIENRDSGS